MNRSLFLIALLASLVVVAGSVQTAQADYLSLPTKDSSAFNWKYEMDVKPNTQDIAAGAGVDWGVYSAPNSGTINGDGTMTTTGGANFQYTSSGTSAAQVASAVSYANGFTMETRLKVNTTGTIAGSFPAAIGFYLGAVGGDATSAGHIFLNNTGIYWGLNAGNSAATGLVLNDTFHTLRVAQEANATTYDIWLDGVYVTTKSTGSGNWDALHWGSNTGAMAGTNVMDYYRVTTGAWAPVPEPSTLVLLATGLFGLLCYAWKKRK